MAGGFSVDRAALAETAKGLTGAIDQLKSMGDANSADEGLGFTHLALSEAEAGSAVARSLSEFCGRWEFGVSTLIRDGYEFGQRLGLTAKAYTDAENDIIGGLKDGLASEFGDPWESDDQAAAGSWKQAFAAVDGAQTQGSKMTAKQAEQASVKAWENTGHDFGNAAKRDAATVTDPVSALTDPAREAGGPVRTPESPAPSLDTGQGSHWRPPAGKNLVEEPYRGNDAEGNGK